MAEPEARQWKDLPADLPAEIACHIPCLIDRFYMSWACHDWWISIKNSPPPRQLPWLLLPEPTTVSEHLLPGPGNMRRISFCCVLCNGEIHNLRIKHDTGDARFFGSYDGGWILLAHGQTDRHTLLNLHTGRPLFLPDYLLCTAPGGLHPHAEVSTIILAATFSSTPTPTAQCFGAGIVETPDGCHRPRLAFWCMEGAGDRRPVAMGLMENFCDPWLRFEDVIHHQGAFHFLTNLGHVFVYEIFKFEEDDAATRLEVRVRRDYFLQGPPQGFNVKVMALYLVESRGELLMVVRLQQDYMRWTNPRTGAFHVYRVTRHLTGAGLVQLAWTELPSLDGRMLFVARGCSRAYEAADFPSFGLGEGIYFLDDRCSDNVDMVSLAPYGVTHRQYTCSDNGRYRWVEGEPRPQVFQRWFPYMKYSDYSPPIWFIP
uniref:Uncharacterized protein n=1 Tax=Avena sativa TaxID=4498 RepID=A0ACD5TX07_AVESA